MTMLEKGAGIRDPDAGNSASGMSSVAASTEATADGAERLRCGGHFDNCRSSQALDMPDYEAGIMSDDGEAARPRRSESAAGTSACSAAEGEEGLGVAADLVEL